MTLKTAVDEIRKTLSDIDQFTEEAGARVLRLPPEIRATWQEQLNAFSRGFGDARMELHGALFTIEKLAATLPNLSTNTDDIIRQMEQRAEQQAQLPRGALVLAYGRARVVPEPAKRARREHVVTDADRAFGPKGSVPSWYK